MKDPGLKIYLFCGMLFALIGAIFLVIGLWMFSHMEVLYENASGDVGAMPYIFSGLGVALLAVGLSLLLVFVRKSKKVRRLVEVGDYIVADVTAVMPDYSVRINGYPTFRVECSYQDPSTGVLHVFRSRNLTRNPGEALVGAKVNVYIDRSDPEYKNYYADIDPLLPETVIH